MKKIIFYVSLFIILLIPFLFTSCSNVLTVKKPDISSTTQNTESSFVCIDRFYPEYGYTTFVLVHRDTKVMYILTNDCGLCVMLDKNGLPLLYDKEL